MRLLLVEDDPLLGDGLKLGLQAEGYTVDWLREGKQALHALLTEDFDLVVLDLGLPGMDGLEVLREIRQRGMTVPVLILTARDAVSDRVGGLDKGADDYLTKPFDLEELSARLRTLLRRGRESAALLLEHEDVQLDPAAREVFRGGEKVSLSMKEFSVLRYLLEHRGKVVSRSRLEQALYGWDTQIESNALEVHVHKLRRKLGATFISTVRGVGYRIG
ncbi:response regulator [Thiolapillus brandeum]|uniref:Two-component response regulator, OmpR family n=1 Tax=Thiolapillus brandeum TaxID=1076588 RepID=A0A7U6JIT4_9GAMM|nr:response regulator [Thiolapillus brandeum]BAO45202.1 two-component response regulator, OmpR family [Thiolapillus brandeum]